MLNKTYSLFLFAACLWLLGCGKSADKKTDSEFENKFVDVSVGDLKIDVEIKLGEPLAKIGYIEEGNSLINQDPERVWVYGAGVHGYAVIFANGQVEGKEKIDPDRFSAIMSEVEEQKASLTQTESQTQTELTKAQIGSLEGALLMYSVDMRTFPDSGDGLSALLKAPDGERNARMWDGPYLDEEQVPLDPWGNEYQYEFDPASGDSKPRIFSAGPDGEENTADDISNR